MRRNFILLGIILLSFVGCSLAAQPPSSLNVPVELNDGFIIGSPVETGLNPDPLKGVVSDIRQGRYGEIHSVLLYKDGLLVAEEYFPGHDYDWDGVNFHGAPVNWDETWRHNVHSVGKSITSACVGIAIKKGFIEGVDDPISKYLPNYRHLIKNGKAEITIEHLLTMTSGLQWDEWDSSYASDENDVIALWLDCQDPIRCILEKPLLHEPGSAFTYSGGNMVLLGEIIKNATGMDIEAFSWKYLFGPLGIEEPPWTWINEDVVYAGGDQLLTPREMLKFGLLYLNNGVWDQKQILPESWIEKSAHPFPGPDNQWWNSILKTIPPGDSTLGRRGYGYTWWTHEFRTGEKTVLVYYALGFGGQRIYVLPGQEAVVVFTSGNYTTSDATLAILKDFVINANEK